MGTSIPCCKKDSTILPDSDINIYQNLNTEPNTQLSRKSSRPNFIKDVSRFNTDYNEQIGIDFTEGIFMKDFISILRNQDKTIQILLNQEDFLADTNRMNKLELLASRNIPSILILKIWSSNNENKKSFSNSNRIEINALGFCGKIHSQRNKYDGYNFFGFDIYKKEKSPNMSNTLFQTSTYKSDGIGEFFLKRTFDEPEEPINDYNLPLDPFEIKGFLNYSQRLFLISYDTDIMKYRIRDLLSGLPTFHKVQSETVLVDNSLINIGDTYIYISFGGRDDELFDLNYDENVENKTFHSHSVEANGMSNNNLINLKIFNKFGMLIHDPINFQPSKSTIKIGRSELNEVCVKDSMISNIHCCLKYDKVVGWTIKDGYSHKINLDYSSSNLHMISTNSTWLYVGNDFTITDGMVFKCGSLLLECRLEESFVCENGI